MHRLSKITKLILFLMLLSPLLAYIYVVHTSLPKTITEFFTFIVFVYGAFYILIKSHLRIPLFAKFALVFAFYQLGWSFFLETDRHWLTEIYHNIQDFSIFFIIVIIYNTHFNDKFIEQSIIVIKATIILAALASIVQVFNPDFLNQRLFFQDEYETSMSLYEFRRSSIFGFIGSNAVGLAYIPLLSVLVGYLFYTKNKYYWVYLLLGGIVAVLTNTRYVMIAFILISLQLFFASKVRFKGFIKYIIILGLSTLVLWQLLISLGYDFGTWYEERLLSEGSISETTRYKAFGNFIRFFPEAPFFGTGMMTEEIDKASAEVGSSHIHVGYLSHLVYYGLVGCFFLYGFWVLLIKELYHTAKSMNYWGSFFGFLAFLWAFATMSQSSIFYYGIIFTLVFDKYYTDKQIIIAYKSIIGTQLS